MTRIISKCSDIKMYPDVTLISILSMPLSAFGFNFVQIKGHAHSHGETITTLKSYVFILVIFFIFLFFAELFTLMRVIIVRIAWPFRKAHLKMVRKTFSLLATRIVLVDIYYCFYSILYIVIFS